MNHKLISVLARFCVLSAAAAMAQQAQVKTTWVPFDAIETSTLVDGVLYRLPAPVDGVLYEPVAPSPKSRIAVMFYGGLKHPSGPELATRGYRVLLVQHSGFDNPIGYEGIAPSIAAGIKYLRGLPGIEKVVLLGHSGTGALVDFYQNLAENGPRVCQGSDKIYPCDAKGLSGLPKADGVVTLDSHIGGGFANLTYMDPAITDDKQPRQRESKLDMFDAKNGYDPKTGGGTYSESFTKAFFAAQAAGNAKRIEAALERLKEIKTASGYYKDDEPLIVPSGDGPGGARLLQADVRLVSRTKAPHPLLKADGTTVTQIVPSVRPPSARASGVGMYQPATSVRRFLATSALRTTSEYGMTEDSISGIDWASSGTSAVTNVEGITVPILIMAMSCHYFLVPDEMIFDHARSKDKQYVIVEGASHVLTACRPEYGDTQKRLFDYVDTWLSAPGRFSPAKM
jgi:pimeloyl-ACP methyl ester carboxylesterase